MTSTKFSEDLLASAENNYFNAVTYTFVFCPGLVSSDGCTVKADNWSTHSNQVEE